MSGVRGEKVALAGKRCGEGVCGGGACVGELWALISNWVIACCLLRNSELGVLFLLVCELGLWGL